MINLEDKIGLPVILHDNNHLEFGDGVDVEKTSERTFGELAPISKDDDKLSDFEKEETAYLMYRGICKTSDRERLSSKNLRFDLTVIMPGKIGGEYIKTFGHFHPKKPGTAVEYPEYYFVAHGKARFLLQNGEDVITAEINAGSGIIIPPGYGHVTINETSEPIVMANWIANDFASDYSEYESSHGAAFNRIESAGAPEWVKNGENQPSNAPKDTKVISTILEPMANKPIYSALDTIDLDFLANPENHIEELKVVSLFH
jgi:glucose-6-phosphate isomerase